ncbi:MAG: UDP-N-acetylmuramate dehydrogenase [Holosporaceae bacterium]|jgi:UDP-N-acetylmuramate dehydrogenase|nr:UDP-N-acetylmuramate dehydrogenase [Holosporaceae bacterium]
MSIISKLPPVKGVLQENVDLGRKSFLGVSGTAQILFTPTDIDDLVFFLRNLPKDFQVTVLGAMSNILIRSGGIRGIVVVLEEAFNKIFIEDNVIEVGAAVFCSKLSTAAANHELGGLEFLTGIPGMIGGAIKMNAGCYGANISDIFIECEGVNLSGQVKWFNPENIEFGYRSSSVSDDIIITRAWFRGMQNVDYIISKKMNEISSKRKNSQPLDKKSCGSAFKNPDGYKAWKLIEAAGCRGMKVGGASISDKHCNFIINYDNATANDVEELGNRVIQKVLENSGIRLEWEIVILGDKAAHE